MKAEPLRALIIAVDVRDPRRPIGPELAEFEALIEATGAEIIDRVIQRLPRVDPAMLIGSGKARDIADRLHEAAADAMPNIIFVFNDLRPRQRINLEAMLPLPIIDRTMLILDIFARRARSREGKLQVELAQLRYRQSNLIGSGADLSRLGGGIGSRGPGETKLEVDRRRIQARVSLLRSQLKDVTKQRATRRGDGEHDPLIALVGYTNVGKSSLLNRLTRSEGSAQAFVANQPFATLDPTMRRMYLGAQRHARLVDTVGFITDLPKELVNAFRATLEELREADVFLHVIDASNPDWQRQRASVEAILASLALDATPVLLVANKIDRRQETTENPVLPTDAVLVSAATNVGLDELRRNITERLNSNLGAHDVPLEPLA